MSDDPERTNGEADKTARPVGRRSWGPDETSPADDQHPHTAHRAARAADYDEGENSSKDSAGEQESRGESGTTEDKGTGSDGPQEPGTDGDREPAPEPRKHDADEPAEPRGAAAPRQPAQSSKDPVDPERSGDSGTEKPAQPRAGASRPEDARVPQEQPSGTRSSGQQHAAAPRPPGKQHTPPRPPRSAQPPREDRGTRAPAQTPAGDQRYSAGELIAQLTPTPSSRSRTGWRARLGLAPSQRELDENRDTEVAKTAFSRPVTIMVANPKGGAGKTPTALLLAAAFGLARGGGVVAWDNNELRGTMPDRSASPHRRNVRDLLAAMEGLQRSDSQFTELAHFLNHQASGTFYTLGSAQTSERVISEKDYRQVHEILARFFQVLVVDTGNNEAAPNWLAVAEVADCLVVPTKWRSDSLIPAARMLETLQDANPDLLRRTVIAATNGPADSQAKVKANGASWFGSSHPIVEIPTDPHIAEGGVLDYAQLKPATRRAALQLAAEVARRLVPADRD